VAFGTPLIDRATPDPVFETLIDGAANVKLDEDVVVFNFALAVTETLPGLRLLESPDNDQVPRASEVTV